MTGSFPGVVDSSSAGVVVDVVVAGVVVKRIEMVAMKSSVKIVERKILWVKK